MVDRSKPAPIHAVEVLTIGDELLLGFTIDTNGAHIARALAPIGIAIARRTSVGDEPDQIRAAVSEALDRTGAVITTGGLGPTTDDRTKESIAALFGRELVLDEGHLAWMRDRWRKRFDRDLPEVNRRQALIPNGARKLENRHGSAPGIWLEDDRGRWVAMLPGVPREMRGMLADELLPLLQERAPAGAVIESRTLRTTGVAESRLGEQIEGAGPIPDGVDVAYLPSVAGVDVRLTMRGRSRNDARLLLDQAAHVIAAAVGDVIYAEDNADLAAVLLDRCRERGLTIAVAESCTGGLLGARLTATPGSSDVVLGGVVAYGNAVKTKLLGVSAQSIESDGAVSEPVVRAMAEAARAKTGASLGLSITGVAGPGGGTDEKPVGTVWIAVSLAGVTESRRLQLWGDRDEIRSRAAQAVMELARRIVAEGA
jgi:nicotinamide-nucleotide amidase